MRRSGLVLMICEWTGSVSAWRGPKCSAWAVQKANDRAVSAFVSDPAHNESHGNAEANGPLRDDPILYLLAGYCDSSCIPRRTNPHSRTEKLRGSALPRLSITPEACSQVPYFRWGLLFPPPTHLNTSQMPMRSLDAGIGAISHSQAHTHGVTLSAQDPRFFVRFA